MKKKGKSITAPDSERGDEAPTGDEAVDTANTMVDNQGNVVTVADRSTTDVERPIERVFQREHADLLVQAIDAAATAVDRESAVPRH